MISFRQQLLRSVISLILAWGVFAPATAQQAANERVRVLVNARLVRSFIYARGLNRLIIYVSEFASWGWKRFRWVVVPPVPVAVDDRSIIALVSVPGLTQPAYSAPVFSNTEKIALPMLK